MKIKKIITARKAQSFRVKKYFKYQTPLVLLFVALFVLNRVQANVIINEIQISGGSGKTSDDYIELYNNSEKAVAIGSWKLRKKTQSGTESSIRQFSSSAIIPAKEYFLWANTGIAERLNADEKTSATISANNSIALEDSEDNIIDQVAWGSEHKNPFIEKEAFLFPIGAAERMERKNFQDKNNNAEDFHILFSGTPTPSGCLESSGVEKCILENEPSNAATQTNDVIINELFPEPVKNSDDAEEKIEFVELYNTTEKVIKIDGWRLVDRGKNECRLKGEIKKNEYLVVESNKEENCTISLNDSIDEFLNLLNENNVIINSVAYENAKENLSYSFDGNKWHWTKYLTRGSENRLENNSENEVEIPQKVFVNVYANFAINNLEKNSKVTWDFGDNHKSYLQSTRHKYEKKGRYQGSVKYGVGSEDFIKEFEIEVTDIAHPKIKIIAIVANPKGLDTGNEFLLIENKSKKKINLLNWSIATCWKKCINHPIKEEFFIKPKKSKNITNKISSFALNNTKAKIEIRYPDGKVAYDVKYKKKKGSIADDEKYVKTKKGWIWEAPVEREKSIKSVKSIKQREGVDSSLLIDSKSPTEGEKLSVISNQSSEKEIEPLVIDHQLSENIPTKKVENKFIYLKNEKLKIELLKSDPKVLGVATIRTENNQYFFTSENREEEHYVVIFWKNFSKNLNEKINLFLNHLIN